MMHYKNIKAIARSPEGDTDFFKIIIDILLGETLAPCLFIICIDYVLQTYRVLIKEN